MFDDQANSSVEYAVVRRYGREVYDWLADQSITAWSYANKPANLAHRPHVTITDPRLQMLFELRWADKIWRV